MTRYRRHCHVLRVTCHVLHITEKMKNTDIIFLFFFMLFQPITAQHSELEQRVSLDLREEPISKALTSITQQTGIRFSYNSQLIDVNKKISIHAENQQLDKVLPFILPVSVSYKQVGKYIIISGPEPEKKTGYNINSPNTQNQPEKSFIKKNIDPIYLKNSSDTFFIQKNYSLSSGIIIDSCHRSITPINVDEMNKKLALLALSVSIAGSQAPAQTEQTTHSEAQKKEESKEVVETVIKERRASQVTFVYPLGTDGRNSSDNEYITSFNIIGGRTGKITGFELASIFNMNKYSSRGVQISGVINRTGIPNNNELSRNVQIAGISNHTQNGISTQIGGVINTADKAHAQISGIINKSKKSDIQVAGVANFTDTSKVQVAGIINATKTNSKVQAAGVINMIDTVNTQVSGIANKANSSFCQISTVNITRKGGFQLGVVNMRDTVDGISIGVINIIKKGGLMEWEASGSEAIQAAISFRSGSQKIYSIISAGYNFSDKFLAIGFGLGTEITLKNRWRFNIEGIHYNLYDKEKNFERDESNYAGLIQIRPTVNYKFAEHLKVFAGPTLNLSVTEKDFRFKTPYSIWSTTEGNTKLDTWVGFTAGIRF